MLNGHNSFKLFKYLKNNGLNGVFFGNQSQQTKAVKKLFNTLSFAFYRYRTYNSTIVPIKESYVFIKDEGTTICCTTTYFTIY